MLEVAAVSIDSSNIAHGAFYPSVCRPDDPANDDVSKTVFKPDCSTLGLLVAIVMIEVLLIKSFLYGCLEGTGFIVARSIQQQQQQQLQEVVTCTVLMCREGTMCR
jgi:hypothetical protein